LAQGQAAAEAEWLHARIAAQKRQLRLARIQISQEVYDAHDTHGFLWSRSGN
jgi:hypothetical protein